MAEGPEGRFHFESFEFDLATGELRFDGNRIRLPDQNARLLTLLLERPGVVVGRDEIRARIWPEGEYLNHTHAISNGINQLRSILRDNPRAPFFIETLPKRGYRFIAEVRWEPEVRSEAVLPLPGVAEEAFSMQAAEAVESSPSVGVPARKGGFALWVGLGLIFVVASVLAWRWHARRTSATPVPGEITLGIAPIEASGAAAQAIAEPFRLELIDAASQLPGVQVRAAHSFPMATSDLSSIRSVAQRLQLNTVLLGKIVATNQTNFEFDFELVRGSDAVHLASFHYSGTKAQLENIRAQIQRDLFLRLSGEHKGQLKPLRSTENTEAYGDYLAGRADLLHPTDEAVGDAISMFQKATQADRSFFQAFAGLGSAYLIHAEHIATDREENYEAARNASEAAIKLNPQAAEAHATLGFLDFRHDWNAAAAEPELKQAIALDPGQAMHHIMYALLLGNTGRFDESLQQIDLAHAVDPLWPPVFLTEIYVASAARRNARALDAAQRLLQVMPEWPLAYDQSAWAYWYAGRHEDAVREWIRMATLEQDSERIKLEEDGIKVLHREGTVAYSRLKLAAVDSAVPWKHPNDFQAAEWQLNADEREAALQSLEAMVRSHDPESLQLAASPAYFSLHGDPKFNALLVQIGLPRPR